MTRNIIKIRKMAKYLSFAIISFTAGCASPSYNKLGYNALINKNNDLAIVNLRLAVVQNSNSQLAAANLAAAYQNSDNFEQASSIYLHIIKKMPECKLSDPELKQFKNRPLSELIMRNYANFKIKSENTNNIYKEISNILQSKIPGQHLSVCA